MLHTSLAMLLELTDFSSKSLYFNQEALRCFRSIVEDCKMRLTHYAELDQNEYFLILYTLRLVTALLNAMHIPITIAYRSLNLPSEQQYLSPITLQWTNHPNIGTVVAPSMAYNYPNFIAQKTQLFKTKEHVNHDDFIFI